MWRLTNAKSAGLLALRANPLKRAAELLIARSLLISRCGAAVVIVGIRRQLRLLLRILLQLVEQVSDGAFKLRVVARAPGCRVHLDFEVGRDTVILDFPLALQTVDGRVRRGDAAAVHQGW